MGKYLSPTLPIESQIKCAIIFYPDDSGAFFLNAVRGQLSELARPFIWEGNRETQDQIAQLFTITDLMSDDVFFGLDCDLIPLITGEEDMNINVNCGCCGDGGGDTLICYGTDGNPVVQTGPTPVDYTPPGFLDETIDPEGDLPDGLPYDDIPAFDAAACGVANAAWWVAAFFISALETIGDALAAIAAGIVALAAALPGGVVAALGAEGLLLVIEDWAAIYAAEDISDKLTDMRTWLDNHREEIVCAIYSDRYNGVTSMWNQWAARMSDMVDSITFVNPFVPFLALRSIKKMLPLKWMSEWLLATADIPLPTTLIDCAECAPAYAFSMSWPGSATTYPDDMVREPADLPIYNNAGLESGKFGLELGKMIGNSDASINAQYVDWVVTVDHLESPGAGRKLQLVYGYPGQTLGTVDLVASVEEATEYSGTFDMGSVRDDWEIRLTSQTTNYNRVYIGPFSLSFYE